MSCEIKEVSLILERLRFVLVRELEICLTNMDSSLMHRYTIPAKLVRVY